MTTLAYASSILLDLYAAEYNASTELPSTKTRTWRGGHQSAANMCDASLSAHHLVGLLGNLANILSWDLPFAFRDHHLNLPASYFGLTPSDISHRTPASLRSFLDSSRTSRNEVFCQRTLPPMRPRTWNDWPQLLSQTQYLLLFHRPRPIDSLRVSVSWLLLHKASSSSARLSRASACFVQPRWRTHTYHCSTIQHGAASGHSAISMLSLFDQCHVCTLPPRKRPLTLHP